MRVINFNLFDNLNISNDLINAPDVAIYFWLVPIFLLKETLKN